MRSSRFQLQSFARRWSARTPSVTSLLVALCISMSCAQWILSLAKDDPLFAEGSIERLFGLSATTLASGSYWQFLSFPLIHHGAWHLLADVLLLYFAGREVEPIIGARQFASLFLTANLAGGLAQWGAMAAGWAESGRSFVGISAGAAAVAAAFATILPELEVTVLLLFVLPLRVRAKIFGFVLVGIGAMLWLSPNTTVVGPVAIIVGTFVGWVYAKALGFGNPLRVERYFRERRQQATRLERMPVDQFLAEEIDPVLEKLAAGGMQSLTRAEKRLLQQGSAKLAATKGSE